MRYAIMVDNLHQLQVWQHDALEQLAAVEGAKCAAIIHNTETFNARVGAWHQRIPKLFNLWSWYVRTQRVGAQKPVAVEDLFKKIETLDIMPTAKGKFVHYFEDKDIKRVKDLKLDFIIRFGYRIIKGPMLDSAKHGIWSYHHNDNRKYRGTPGAFWEIYNNDGVTGAILQRITEKLDDGQIIYRGTFQTQKHSYAANLNQSLEMSAPWLAQVARTVMAQGKLPTIDKDPSTTKIYKSPKNSEMLAFFWRLLCGKMQRIKRRFTLGYWNIALASHTPEQIIKTQSLGDLNFFPLHETGRFIADPFFVKTKKGLDVLFEDFHYGSKGVINAVSLNKGGFSNKIKPLLKENLHFSYPFIFEEENGEQWLIPECCETEAQPFYKIENGKPIKQPVDINIKGIVDPTIIKRGDHYWLFYSKDKDRHCTLYIAYADAITGPWHTHPMNPVKTDVRSSRPGGNIFEVDGMLYRPAQNCARQYGASLSINKITKLTINEYHEELAFELLPEDKKYKHGLHHLAVHGNNVIVDAKHDEFSVLNIINKITRRLGL